MLSSMSTYRGVVHPWECDTMGHLNAGFYGRIFDDANAAAIHHLGYRLRDGIAEGIGWAEARLELEFRHELLADAIVHVSTCVQRVGTKSITFEHTLRDETNGRIAAIARSVTVCFDLRARASREIPKNVRRRAEDECVQLHGEKPEQQG